MSDKNGSRGLDHDGARLLFGGYLLGGLDRADQDALDAHLYDCAPCRDELTHLAPVPDLLRGAPQAARRAVPGDAPPPPDLPGLDRLLRQVRAERTGRRTRIRLLAAAAAVLVVVAFGVGLLLARPGGQPGRTPAPVPSTATADRTARFTTVAGGTTAGTATFIARQWGTSVSVELTNLPPAGPYALRVVGRDGQVEQAATWGSTPGAAARLTGASSMQLPTVRAVHVVDRDGRVLATADLAN